MIQFLRHSETVANCFTCIINFFAECCKFPSVDLQVSLQGISDSIEVQTQVTKPALTSTQQTQLQNAEQQDCQRGGLFQSPQ